MPASSSSSVPTWDGPVGSRGTGTLVLVAAVAALVVLLVAALVAGPLAAAAVALLAAAAIMVAKSMQSTLMVRRLRARAAEDARLGNIAAGLASDLGRPVPQLFVAPGPPNAFVIPGGGAGGIVVTESLLASSSRTELEAVVASCLVRLGGRAIRRARWIALARPFAPIAAPVFDLDLDVSAAALTRYPPALASAIEGAEPRSDWAAPFAFVAPPPWQRPAGERAADLRDL